MFYVYILYSQKDKKLYIGYTNNLKQRYLNHSNGLVKATKFRRPLKLIYYEAYLNRDDAKKRELFFKGGKGHNELKIQLEKTLRSKKYLN